MSSSAALTVTATLATATDRASSVFSDTLPWLIALAVLVLVGFGGLLLIRRYLRNPAADANPGFTLQDLRDLHAAGELSDDEFASARDAMLRRVTERPDPPTEASPPSDEPAEETPDEESRSDPSKPTHPDDPRD